MYVCTYNCDSELALSDGETDVLITPESLHKMVSIGEFMSDEDCHFAGVIMRG